MEKVKVKSCIVKTSGTNKNTGKPYTIYTVVLEDGRSGDAFEQLPIGAEQDMEIKDVPYNGVSQLKFTIVKPNTGGGKFGGGFKPNTKVTALQEANKYFEHFPVANMVSDNVLTVAKKFNEWLNSQE